MTAPRRRYSVTHAQRVAAGSSTVNSGERGVLRRHDAGMADAACRAQCVLGLEAHRRSRERRRARSLRFPRRSLAEWQPDCSFKLGAGSRLTRTGYIRPRAQLVRARRQREAASGSGLRAALARTEWCPLPGSADLRVSDATSLSVRSADAGQGAIEVVARIRRAHPPLLPVRFPTPRAFRCSCSPVPHACA